MIYLDASAIVTLVRRRRYVGELRDYLDGRPYTPLGTSTISLVETVLSRPTRWSGQKTIPPVSHSSLTDRATRILTLDHKHFRALRPLSGAEAFTLLPADAD